VLSVVEAAVGDDMVDVAGSELVRLVARLVGLDEDESTVWVACRSTTRAPSTTTGFMKTILPGRQWVARRQFENSLELQAVHRTIVVRSETPALGEAAGSKRSGRYAG
jgi:hypothetical protein